MDPTPPLVQLFTAGEKRELGGARFREVALDRTDFADADLAGARFERVALRGCDFRRCDLRGASFVGCDLRGAAFGGARLGGNRFHGSSLDVASGLTDEQRDYVVRRGGRFEAAADADRPSLRLLK
jgi:uncharacterized protein YjbI with pentapeptide repeats